MSAAERHEGYTWIAMIMDYLYSSLLAIGAAIATFRMTLARHHFVSLCKNIQYITKEAFRVKLKIHTNINAQTMIVRFQILEHSSCLAPPSSLLR